MLQGCAPVSASGTFVGTPLNPLGLKGAGEGGANAVGAAVAAAIDDAIGIPGAITRLPVTPQRLREMLKRAGS